MNKENFIVTFAHFMSESDLNSAYDAHFKELGHMNQRMIENWLKKILDQSPADNWIPADQPPQTTDKVNIIIQNRWGDKRLTIGKYSNGTWYRDGRLAMEMVMDITGESVVSWNPIPEYREV